MHVPFDPAIVCWRIYPMKFNANIKMLIHCNIFCKGEKSCMLTNTWDSPQKKWAGPICIDKEFQDTLFSEKASYRTAGIIKIYFYQETCVCVWV